MNGSLISWYLFCAIPAFISFGIIFATETGRVGGGGPAAVSGNEIIMALWLTAAFILSVICILINLIYLKWTPEFIGEKSYAIGAAVISSAPFLITALEFASPN